MKKELLIASLFACGAAVAGEFTSETTGILKCTSSTKETIVSIPWVGYGENAKIQVNEIVRTTGLENGDKLLAPNGAGGYDSWTLSAGAWVADNKTTIDPSGSDTQPGADASKTLDRGDGFWLVKNDSYTPGTSFDYYLLGQKPTTEGVSKNVSGDFSWHLVAPTATEDVTDILTKISNPGAGDLITLVDGTQYKRMRTTGWKDIRTGAAVENVPLAKGQGFWYTTNNSNVTINL